MSTTTSKASLLIIFLTVFIDLLGFGMVLPLLPLYAKVFGATMDAATLGWTIGLLMASFSAMQFLFAPLWGRLSDRVGRRPVLMIGLAGSVLFYTLFAMATLRQSLWLLFVSRIGAGIAGATIPTAQAYIADTTSLDQRARGMALIGAAFGLGFTFGPLIGAIGFLAGGETIEQVELSPWPGYLAAGLSAVALLLAVVKLPESRRPSSMSTRHKRFDRTALRTALSVPSVPLLLLTFFVAVFSFANFESTLSLLLNATSSEGGFGFAPRNVLFAFAFVGFVLSFAQGFLVRRLASRVSEATLASVGAAVSIVGFVLLAVASLWGSLPLLLGALVVEVTGFAFVTPSIQSLISRRSDPAKQGSVLGVAQSAGSLARIVGPVVGIRMFAESATLPFWSAAGLMLLGWILIGIAARGGHDYSSPAD